MKLIIRSIFLALALMVSLSLSVQAADDPVIINPFDNLQIGIPGATRFQDAKIINEEGKKSFATTWIAEYIVSIYNWGIGALGILAMMAIAIGGVLWIVSAGNPGRIGEAKSWIINGLVGLGLGLGSYILLGMINADLVGFKSIEVSLIKEKGLPGEDDYAEMSNDGSNFNPYQGPKNVITVEVETLSGTKRVQVDQSIAENLKNVMQKLKAIGFNVRGIGGYRPGSKFCHGRALAVDINVPQNYCIDCYSKKGSRVGSYYRPKGVPGAGIDYQADPLSLTPEAVKVFTDAGWCWGGNWRGFKDYMHFSINCSAAECGKAGTFDFSQSVKNNHKKLGISL